ncbi:MAG: tRNA (adenosine(37)-N6)-dimethylallyltransferase MiaA [Lachnospiraceae bacterium]|nr:tRNA (adenosine(37)-N6)-dimethylallyltransferase MiaA [Lachnospiraceae bacterium]
MTETGKPMVILTGPTAVGKTELSIKLAKKIGGEIISADSMQVYRYMDIGSAKIKEEERQGISHHLIDVLNPEEEFNVYIFQKMAEECLKGIYERGQIPVLVGGTGFYIQALLYDIEFEPQKDSRKIREELEKIAAEKGNAVLYQKLKELDPESADLIHENNSKRIIRALEFYELNKMPISKHNKEQRERKAAYNACYFVLNDEREKIYERIDRRVDKMMEEGLLEEVKQLKNKGCHKNMVSMQGLGYKELLSYLNDECTLEEAIYQIKRDSRHFAKRQLTWFRRERDVIWINKQNFSYDDDNILAFIIKTMEEKGL